MRDNLVTWIGLSSVKKFCEGVLTRLGMFRTVKRTAVEFRLKGGGEVGMPLRYVLLLCVYSPLLVLLNLARVVL